MRLIYLAKTPLFFLLAICAVPAPSFAQRPGTAMEAYAYVEQKCRAAAELWKQPNARKEDIEQGIKILEDALIYTDDPLVRDLARGNPYLQARPINIYFYLAQAHALLDHRIEAIEYLRKLYAEGLNTSFAEEIRASKPLIGILQESGFNEAMAKAEAKKRLWDRAAFSTSYHEILNQDEKIAGLSLFWSEVKYNFANFDLVPELDWNRLYLIYLPKVQAAKNTFEYYRVLQEMCAQLHDGHTNVYLPKELEDSFSRPPILAELIEGKVLIGRVTNKVLLAAGIRVGLEIVSIDGMPVLQYGEQRVAPYVSSSTKQDRDVRTYSYSLFSGPKDQPIQLELRDERGAVSKKSVPRSGYATTGTSSSSEFKVLDGNIGYLNLKTFEDWSVAKSFNTIFPDLARTDALIIDVRDNGGGDDGIGFTILSYLTSKSFQTRALKTFTYRPIYRAAGLEPTWDSEPGSAWSPNGKKLYAKPVFLLTSARTFSAAEDFAVAFDYMKRGKIVGEPTGGSTGKPMHFALPGGGEFRVSTKHDTYPDGKEFVGVGVQPDILVHPTVKGIRANQDEVLDAALNYLKGMRKPE